MATFDLRVQAHAKINLYLDIIGKRPDGYHEIETIFHSIGLHDEIYLRKRTDRQITVHCEHPHVPCDPRNLAYRAAKLLLDDKPDLSGVEIMILKRIPVAAGLGGGSADAAAVLCGVNALFDLGLTQRDLMQLGVQLGADVPFCILGGAALGRGIGEILTPLPPMEETWILLANPGFAISTAWVYQQINLSLTVPKKNVTILARCLRNGEFINIARHLYNGLEVPALSKYPAVAKIKAKLNKYPSSCGVLMSGSGATVFALMQNQVQAHRAALNFENDFVFCSATPMSSVGVRIS
ncbi:4-(cytidine 5'-diphospho)-2-C-methyl-D-erythritol kinase [Candidatus Poribacteria bacterium]|nr:MAG: 4-(cytidine 5'-diphospho)-2-C-methyl-D-erythritol kinase [Candidatus Poribacteria bacterium]